MPDLKRVSSKRKRSASRKLSGQGLDASHLKDEVDAADFERDWGLSPQKEVRQAMTMTYSSMGKLAECLPALHMQCLVAAVQTGRLRCSTPRRMRLWFLSSGNLLLHKCQQCIL